MQVNFTGIKNVGYEHAYYASQEKRADNILAGDTQWLNIQLTDDYNGKHLTGFKKALEKSGLSYSDYRNPVNKDFLNLAIDMEVYDDDGDGEVEQQFILNDMPLRVNDETLPMFSFLAKLLNEIIHKPSKEFVVNKDYLDSDDVNNGLALSINMEEIFEEDYDDVIREAHEPSVVKDGAECMHNVIMETMEDYFTVNV